MKRFGLGFLMLLSALLTNSFAFPSAELQALWDIDQEKVDTVILRTYQKENITVKELCYFSREYAGSPSRIFGYYCYPSQSKKPLPAILLVHGGGGSANLGNTIEWAKRGYVVMSIDLPGKGDQRANSRSTGPDMTVPALLCTSPSPVHNYLIFAVAATRNAITCLTQQEEVDPERIGMVGLSWGGVITLLTNGQDKRLKTAVNIFGAGYIPEGCTWQKRFDNKSEADLQKWYTYLDPKNFLESQHAPILFVTGTNDHCYYLPTFQKSYAKVNVPKKIYLVPNLRHQFRFDTQKVVWQWLDNKLKAAEDFPEINLLQAFKRNEKLIIPVTVQSSCKVEKVVLYYAQGSPSRFTKRVWTALPAYYEDGVYYFGLKPELIAPEMMFYITAFDEKNGASSTPVSSVFTVNLGESKKTFALSSPIDRINSHGKPLRIIGVGNLDNSAWINFSKKDNSYYLIEGKSKLDES
ncbi:MAG: acetylxylan esterase [bacterium]